MNITASHCQSLYDLSSLDSPNSQKAFLLKELLTYRPDILQQLLKGVGDDPAWSGHNQLPPVPLLVQRKYLQVIIDGDMQTQCIVSAHELHAKTLCF